MKLIIFRVAKSDGLTKRLRELVPLVEAFIKAISGGIFNLAFKANDGSLFAWVVATKEPSRVIATRLGREVTGVIPTDQILVLELGADHGEYNQNVVLQWIQRHMKLS